MSCDGIRTNRSSYRYIIIRQTVFTRETIANSPTLAKAFKELDGLEDELITELFGPDHDDV